MLTKTPLIVFFKSLGQLEYIVMSDSEKIKIIIFLRKKKEDPRLFWARKLKIHIQSVFIYLYIIKDIFILILYSMGSFSRCNETLFQFFCNIKNNLNFSENSEICIFFIKIEEFGTKFRLDAYQNVFNCVFYIFESVGICCDE